MPVNAAFVNGINIFSFSNNKELIDFVNYRKEILVAINAEKIINADLKLKKIINQNIGYADGIGAVYAMRKKGFKNTAKIAGCELWLDIIRRYHNEKTFYLIGSTKPVIENTVCKLKSDFPGIKILNYRDGYLDEPAINILKTDLMAQKPDVVFVGMGSPKQEYLMGELISVHPALYQGLGGSFDVYAGKVDRAPRFFIKIRAEWLYRLFRQPLRIKRQIKLINFTLLLLCNKL